MNKLAVPGLSQQEGHTGSPFFPRYPSAGDCKVTFGFNTIREKAVCPGSPNQTGRLGQTDPDPHTGVSYKGTVVSHQERVSLPYCSKDTYRMPLPKLVKT